MNLNSWKSLPQEPRWNKQRIRCVVFRLLIFFLLASAFCVVGFFFHPSAEKQPFKTLIFSTNGVLTEAWLKSHLSMPWGKNLLSINLEELQVRILKYKQIQQVNIVREFPDTLKISLDERVACGKVFVSKNGKKSLMLVSKEGFIFSPYGYKKEMIRLFPTIANIPTKLIVKNEIIGFSMVCKLIKFLKENAKDLLLNLHCISLEHFDPFLQSYWRFVDLKFSNSFTIVFPLESLDNALRNLKSILRSLSKNQRNSLKKINVALTAPTIELK